MARSLHTFEAVDDVDVSREIRHRSDRSTARALAAAIAALAITTVVISYSTSALDPQGTVTANRFDSGTIELIDDDEGRALVDIANMAPGRPTEACITVTYAGSVLPVDVRLSAGATGDVAEYLDVVVERGRPGEFGTCDGFIAEDEVYAGNVRDLVEGSGVQVGVIRTERASIGFKFTFELVDRAEAAGRAGSLDVVWEATPR